MKYLSLFSGIGGFETAIHQLYPDAECVGYSEIDSNAIKVYHKHFPTHINLGDITKVTKRDIVTKCRGTTLVVGGFPCTNLTSMARGANIPSDTLQEGESAMFGHLCRILSYLKNVHVVIENNASMTKQNRNVVTNTLMGILKRKVYVNVLNNSDFGLQSRRRIIWTTFPLDHPKPTKVQTWKDVYDNSHGSLRASCEFYNKIIKASTKPSVIASMNEDGTYSFMDGPEGRSRWQVYMPSDTHHDNTRTILACKNYVIDWIEDDKFMFRQFSVLELERLMGYDDGYTSGLSRTRAVRCLGKSVPVMMMRWVLGHL